MTTEYFANYSRVPTHPGFGPWKQDAYSYHQRANLAPANMYFYYVNGAQAAIGLILNSWELYSVVSKGGLTKRLHQLLAALCFTNLLFNVTLLIYYSIRLQVPLFTDMPNSWSACLATSFFIVQTLVATLSLFTFAGYERYCTICSMKRSDRLSDRQVLMAFLGSNLLGMIAASMPMLGFGSYVLQPSGLYCNSDFFDLASFLKTGSLITLALGLSAYFYGNVLLAVLGMKKDAPKSTRKVKGKDGRKRASSFSLSREGRIAISFMMLVGFFLICWTPALLMAFVSVAQAEFAYSPFFDIIAALFVTFNTAFSPCLDMYLFRSVRENMFGLVGLGHLLKASKTAQVGSDDSNEDSTDVSHESA